MKYIGECTDGTIPMILIFGIAFFGILLGEIRIKGVSLGYSGVLILSIIVGYIISLLNSDSSLVNPWSVYVYKLIAKIGTGLFISSVGIEAGRCLATQKKARFIKAFFGGAMIAVIGGIITTIFILCIKISQKDFLIGIFSGAMTSTPALQLASEMSKGATNVSLGYGISYPIGLLSAVLFVQTMTVRKKQENPISSCDDTKKADCVCSVSLVLFSVFGGMLVNYVMPLGMTVLILLMALFIGYIYTRKSKKRVRIDEISSIGLIMFLSASGIQAGKDLIHYISAVSILLASAVSLCSILAGYIVCKYVMRFSKEESLVIVSGGMTSTPAIGVLKKANNTIDFSLFTAAYIGALIVRVDDNIEISSEIGKIVISAPWKAQMKKQSEIYMIVDDPSVKSRAIVSPTFNGVSIMAPVSNERTFRFRIQYYAQNLKVKSNGKYTAFLYPNNIPLFTVSSIATLNSMGKIVSHCEIKHKKINDNVYELSVFTSENNANYLLFEINVYEPKLFLDTTVESKNTKLTNTFGGVAFMDNTDSFGEMWLYSKLNVSQLKMLNDKKIINARLHIPNLNRSKKPLIFNDVTAFFCSFDSNWENKIPIKESGRSDNIHNRYYTFDFTNHICDEKKRFRITNGFAIKANNENNGVSVISTSDCYYAPQILEIKYI